MSIIFCYRPDYMLECTFAPASELITARGYFCKVTRTYEEFADLVIERAKEGPVLAVTARAPAHLR